MDFDNDTSDCINDAEGYDGIAMSTEMFNAGSNPNTEDSLTRRDMRCVPCSPVFMARHCHCLYSPFMDGQSVQYIGPFMEG